MTVTDINGNVFGIREDGEFDMRFAYSKVLAKKEEQARRVRQLRADARRSALARAKKVNFSANRDYLWKPKNTNKNLLAGIFVTVFVLALIVCSF